MNPLLPIGLLAALGAVVAWRRSGATVTHDDLRSGTWTANSGVNLNDAQRAYLDTLRRKLPQDVPLHVTSGTRTPEEQASAMLKKVELGGEGEITSLYRKSAAVVAMLLAQPTRSVDSWAAVIRTHGMGLSRHLSGRSFDLRSHNLTPEQVVLVVDAIASTGGRALVESTPAHIHVDIP